MAQAGETAPAAGIRGMGTGGGPVALPLPAPGSAAAQRSEALYQRLLARIRAGGSLSFQAYMQAVLYSPGLGYYDGAGPKLGPEGDFVTAPELSPLFAGTLARQVGELLAGIPGGCVLEAGAGSGRLAHDLLLALEQLGCLPRRYLLLEISADLRARQEARLQQLPAHLRQRVEWLTTIPPRIDGVIIANELLDALPVHRVVVDDAGAWELHVAEDQGQLVEVLEPLPQGPLAQQVAALGLAPPYCTEINLQAQAWVRSMAAALGTGAMLLFDYGYPAAEYYHPQRHMGTLMCHYRHRAHDNPYWLPGLQDITAHVDFTAMASAGVEEGLRVLGFATQGAFLVNAGITDLLEQADPGQMETYLPALQQVKRLVMPDQSGEAFKVLAMGRHCDGPLSGFARFDQTHRL